MINRDLHDNESNFEHQTPENQFNRPQVRSPYTQPPAPPQMVPGGYSVPQSYMPPNIQPHIAPANPLPGQPHMPANLLPQAQQNNNQNRNQTLQVLVFIKTYFFIAKSCHENYFIVDPPTLKIYFIDDPAISNMLKNKYLKTTQSILTNKAIKDSIDFLKAEECIIHNNLYVRVACFKHVAYVQMNDYEFLSIYSNGAWNIQNATQIHDPNFQFKPWFFKPNAFEPTYRPIFFNGYPRQLPLITNDQQRQSLALFQIFNKFGLKDSELLLITWMISAWIPDGNLTALEITGEPQSGRTTLQKIIRLLIDPSVLFFSKLPNNAKELKSILLDSYVLSFDHVSTIKPEIQKEFSRLLTGDFFELPTTSKQETRKFFIKRPIILNSIDSTINEPELSKFTITVDLEPLKNVKIITFENLIRDSHDLFAQTFSELASLTAYVFSNPRLKQVENTFSETTSIVHLTEFCNIGKLIAERLGYNSSTFWEQFKQQRERRFTAESIKNPVVEAIRLWIENEEQNSRTLSPQGWISELKPYRKKLASDTNWPSSAKYMGSALKHAAPILREHGIRCFSQGKRGSYCFWQIEPIRVIAREETQDMQDIEDYKIDYRI
jgi:energy-coupling factor transporter ATP-binding protein EcfA2